MSSSGRKRFLDPETLEEAASEVSELARDEHVRVALIGGYALQLYGSPRLTGDIDVAAEDEIEALPQGKTLSFGGFQSTAPNGTPVDLVLRDDDYTGLYEEAIRESVRMQDVAMPVARLEHIAAMKMVAGRARDDADLEWIILSGEADLSEARAIIRRHLGPYAAQEWEQLVDETKWRASRGRS
jgi:hypothetical protein